MCQKNVLKKNVLIDHENYAKGIMFLLKTSKHRFIFIHSKSRKKESYNCFKTNDKEKL